MDGSEDLSVTAAVYRDLVALPEPVMLSTEAAAALALAKELDMGRQMSAAPVARELLAVVDRLRAWAGEMNAEGDGVDELAAARVARRAAASVSESAAPGEFSGA